MYRSECSVLFGQAPRTLISLNASTNHMFCGTWVALVDFMITEREYALLRTGAVVDPSPYPHTRLERDIFLPICEILLQGGGWMHDIK